MLKLQEIKFTYKTFLRGGPEKVFTVLSPIAEKSLKRP